MIYELRTYQLKMGATPQYLAIAESRLLPALAEHGLRPVGFWTTDIGTLNEVVHLWAYQNLNERQEKWADWAADPRRPELLTELSQIIVSQSNKILSPTSFSELR
jgi:hypothetical protein